MFRTILFNYGLQSRVQSQICAIQPPTYPLQCHILQKNSAAKIHTEKKSLIQIGTSNLFSQKKFETDIFSKNGLFSSEIIVRSLSGLNPKELTGLSATELKTFLRQKNVNFTEDHSCLIIQIPKHLMEDTKPEVSWESIDESVVPVHINKTTGIFIVPELGLGGEWKLFKVTYSIIR